jgi:hypothetical protein
VGEKVLYKPVEKEWTGWPQVAKKMTTACGAPCTPDYSRFMALCASRWLPVSCLGKANQLGYGYDFAGEADKTVWPDGGR